MKKVIIILSLLFTANIYAITLEEARLEAERNYPLLRDYNLLELTKQYTIENITKVWLPQICIQSQATWQSEVPSYPDVLSNILSQQGIEINGLGKFQYKAAIDIRQSIWDGGRSKAQQAVAKAESEVATAENDVELYQLRKQVDNLFFSILLLESQTTSIKATCDLLESNLDIVKSMVNNGVAMQSDEDAVKVELLSTRQQLASINETINAYRQMLNLYLQRNDYPILEVPQEISYSTTQGFSLRPEMGVFTTREKLTSAGERQIKAAIMPQINAFAQGFFGYPTMDFMGAMKDRTPGFNAMIGISAVWNIGELYTRKNKIAKLRYNIDRLQVWKDIFTFNTTLQADQAKSEINRLKIISVSDQEIVELRRRVRKASESQLREGIVKPIDLLLRITEEKNAAISANTHHIEYLKAIYSLETIYNK